MSEETDALEKRYTILYVDDEMGNLRVFNASFKKHYHILTASSGEEALQILASTDVQLIITDQKMPRMTGVELLEHIVGIYPNMIRIILTGYSDVDDIIRALNKCGIYRYLMKPWQKDAMLHTLEEALEIYQLRTDRHDLLEELQTTNEQLERRIEERTSELSKLNDSLKIEIEERKLVEQNLKEARDRAEEASLAKQMFLSTMSHEIRTPLNSVLGMAHLLQLSELSENQHENLRLLMFSAKNLLALINDILDFSKIEAGKLDLEHEPFDIQEIFNNMLGIYEPKVEEKALSFQIIVDPKLKAALIGDQMRLIQILNNLLSNAFKFTEKGEIKLSINQISEEGQQVRVRFAVKDTGIGIPDHKKLNVFEQFSQASSSTTRKYGGTGLGLAITKRLVDLQGGTIDMQSVIDQGTTFTVELPFGWEESVTSIGQTATRQTIQAQTEATDFSHLNILLVEDNPINQILMRKFLMRWQANYEIANNGLEALEKVATKAFDLVLMDIQMPEMDGYDATIHIRSMSDPYFQKLPIIALTASTLQGEDRKIQTVGMNDYVLKPFDPQRLVQVILKHTGG